MQKSIYKSPGDITYMYRLVFVNKIIVPEKGRKIFVQKLFVFLSFVHYFLLLFTVEFEFFTEMQGLLKMI